MNPKSNDTPGNSDFRAIIAYGAVATLLWFALAPQKWRVNLPVYGHDTIVVSHAGALMLGLGVALAAGGTWVVQNRPYFAKRGVALLVLGCSAPMWSTESPVSLLVTLPILILGIRALLRAPRRAPVV